VHEHRAKIIQTVINVIGIVALIIGLAESQQLNLRNPNKPHIKIEMDLDMILLRFTSVFGFLYISFTVMTGILKPKFLYYEDTNTAFGVIYTIEIVLQIAFIYNLKIRVSIIQ
jgi:hypothetical protein